MAKRYYPRGLDENELKFLLIDIEATYAKGYFFPSKREQYIRAEQIEHEQYYPCAAFKWLGLGKKAYVVKTTDDMKRFDDDFRDDYIVAKTMHDVMSEADIIIAHNGDNFDMKHLNVAFQRHRLGAIPEKKTIDTLKAARKYFAFSGNSLADLLRRFGHGEKEEKPCWKALTDGCPNAVAKAAKYCAVDVEKLEKVFIELRPYMRRLPTTQKKGRITECHACQSKLLHLKGGGFDGRRAYQRVRCRECGHEMRGDIKYYLKG